MDQAEINKIQDLIKRTLKDYLPLKELYAEWDESWDSSEFLELLFHDLEIALEHMPGYFLKKGTNIEKWENSMEYHRLKIDCELVSQINELTPQEIIARRNKEVVKLLTN